MNLSIKTIEASLTLKILDHYKPEQKEITNFKQSIIKFINGIKDKESEEYNKNLIRTFLQETHYSQYTINTKAKIDLAIYHSNEYESFPIVLIETKKPKDKDCIRKDNLHCKSFYQLILYYLDERIGNNNNAIKYLIITDCYDWFLFDCNEFDQKIYKMVI